MEIPKPPAKSVSMKTTPQQTSSFGSPWGVDDLLQFSEFDSSDKVRERT